MALIIPFPGAASELPTVQVPVEPDVLPRATSAQSSPTPVVCSIRKGRRVPKKNRDEDDLTVAFARLAASYACTAAETDPSSEEHRLALHMQGIDRKLPKNNLRCILSTLDEERDFDLRCAELDILRAEHALEGRRIDRLKLLEGLPWWDSPTLKPLVDENNRRWAAIVTATAVMADTAIRNRAHLEKKRRMIGTAWLKAKGELYDRFRAAIAADEEWLDANRPKKPVRHAGSPSEVRT